MTVISTTSTGAFVGSDGVWVLPFAQVVTNVIDFAIENTSGPSVTLEAFVRVDGFVLSPGGPAIGLFADGDPVTVERHTLTVGATGTVVGGLNFMAVYVEGIGARLLNRGEISGGGGVQMIDVGLGSFENGGLVSGSGSWGWGLVIERAVGFRVLNSGTLTGNIALDIIAAQVEITNTGTISGTSGTAITLRNGIASMVLTNFGDVIGNITVSAELSFSDTVVNGGRILGYVDLGDGGDTFQGRGGSITGAVFGAAGDDLLVTGLGEELLYGGTGNDTLRAGADDDVLRGDAGNDTLLGQDGDDEIYGNVGADRLAGGRGDDTLAGGTSADVFLFARNGGDDLVTDFTDGTDRIDLTAFHFANATTALSGAASRPGGVLLSLAAAGGGTVFLDGLTLAQLTAADLIL